jgi:hypothetical protein
LLNVSAYLLPSVKVKVKFTLEQVTKTQRGCRDIDILFIQPWR